MNRNGKSYDDMTLEELQREAREALLDTDIIDGPLTAELERLREALARKRPVEYLYTPEESWARFLEDHGEELGPFLRKGPCSAGERAGAERTTRGRADGRRHFSAGRPVRRLIIAAVIAVLLAGAALAANYTGLWAWAPRWNASAGRYEPAAMEASGDSPIPAALAELGITEPLYPAKLPEGFVITESHISEDPLVLMEQYARGEKRLSITITPVKGVRSAVYQKSGMAVRELRNGLKAHFIFENEGTITAIWFTKNYATYISGDISIDEITEIILSIDSTAEGGDLP